MSHCQEFKDAMQELIDANQARVEAIDVRDVDAYYAAMQRMDKAEETALELMDKALA